MKRSELWPLLPHEVFFGLFLLITWLRLGFAAGFLDGDALLYIVLLIGNAWAIWFCRSGEGSGRWRLGLLFYPLAMNVAFILLKTAVPKIQTARADALLQRVDAIVVGGNLSLRAQSLIHPALTEFFSFCYILFFPYLLISMIYYFCGDVTLLKKFVTGLFTIYGIGFLGYTLFPAAGPYLTMADQFTKPLGGWWITKWNATVVAAGSNKVDVFPSLHCAISSFLLFFDRKYRPWRFKLYIVPAAGLWFSTIYLRYHYFIDVVCGFALAAFGLWVARRYPRTTMAK
jgi:membrane-associated phospholipid phosphatase